LKPLNEPTIHFFQAVVSAGLKGSHFYRNRMMPFFLKA
jgi:hypothetical protein